VDEGPAVSWILGDCLDVEVGHQVGAGVHIDATYERHDLVETDKAECTAARFPHGIVGEHLAQSFGLGTVERVGVARGEFGDVEPIVGGETHTRNVAPTPESVDPDRSGGDGEDSTKRG